jgi:hypothetical protein
MPNEYYTTHTAGNPGDKPRNLFSQLIEQIKKQQEEENEDIENASREFIDHLNHLNQCSENRDNPSVATAPQASEINYGKLLSVYHRDFEIFLKDTTEYFEVTNARMFTEGGLVRFIKYQDDRVIEDLYIPLVNIFKIKTLD